MGLARWLLAVVVAVPVAAHAERWVGVAHSANGPTLKVILRGPAVVNADGTFKFTGRYRCIGASCLAQTGVADALFFNDDANTGLGHETVVLSLTNGVVCASDEYLDGEFEGFPPPVGTELTVDYLCDDANGDVVDTGSVDITRRR